MLPDKKAVHDALLASMRAALSAIAHSAKDAAAGATHEENRSEGDKDMRATEQSYVARGQAMRAEELAEQVQRMEQLEIATCDAIAAGALVRVSIEDDEKVFYVVPWGGGTELVVGRVKVTVITPSSPIGRALLGKGEGDDFELTVRGALRECAIEELR